MWKPLPRLGVLALLVPLAQAAALAAQDDFFESNGVRLHFSVSGDGPPLVILHGFAGNLDTWRMFGTTAALEKDFQVIALDVRGHGQSDKPHDPEKYGLECVDDVVRLLDHMDLPEAHVVGYSMGGMLALKLAARHPERVTSAVIGGFGWYRFAPQGEDMLDEVADSLASGNGLGPLVAALTPVGDPLPSEAEIARMNLVVSAQNDVEALAACARGFRALELTKEELLACKVPMVCLVGDKDSLKADVDRLTALREDIEAVIVRGGTHQSTGLSPLFVQTIRTFAGEREPAPVNGHR